MRHKQTSEILNSGQYKLVLSTAKCHYYSASLDIYDLPPFSAEMIAWLQRFNSAITSHSEIPYDLVFKFMDYFGTHVPIEVMYGASFTNVDQFISSEYNSLQSNGVSVDTQASFASLFNIGVDDFSVNQKQTISQFRNFAETVT